MVSFFRGTSSNIQKFSCLLTTDQLLGAVLLGLVVREKSIAGLNSIEFSFCVGVLFSAFLAPVTPHRSCRHYADRGFNVSASSIQRSCSCSGERFRNNFSGLLITAKFLFRNKTKLTCCE